MFFVAELVARTPGAGENDDFLEDGCEKYEREDDSEQDPDGFVLKAEAGLDHCRLWWRNDAFPIRG